MSFALRNRLHYDKKKWREGRGWHSSRVDRGVGKSLQQSREPDKVDFVIDGALSRQDIPALCERLRVALESSTGDTIICDVEGLAQVDVVAVDALARLQLLARRYGRRLRVRHASAKLQELLALLGLSQVVPLESALSLQPEGQTEEREQLRGVEEEANSGDATI